MRIDTGEIGRYKTIARSIGDKQLLMVHNIFILGVNPPRFYNLEFTSLALCFLEFSHIPSIFLTATFDFCLKNSRTSLQLEQ